jgi:hypothetical protein
MKEGRKSDIEAKVSILLPLTVASYVFLAAFFLMNYQSYLEKPDSQTWDGVQHYLIQNRYGMEPLLYKPGWLRNYATDNARFRGFNLGPCDGCSAYWLLSMRDEPPPNGYWVAKKDKINGLYVSRVQNQVVGEPSSDGLVLSDPEITIASPTSNKTCPFRDGMIGPECYSEDWQKIGRIAMSAGGEGKVCLFVHPRNNVSIIILYRDVTVKDRIAIYTGISDDMVVGNMGKVFADVYLNDRQAGKIIQDDRPGWTETSIDTSQYARGKVAVKIVVYTNDDRKRHFCIDARIT